MKAEDIFLGPILRRAQKTRVVICIATFKPLNLKFSVKRADAEEWLGHDAEPFTVKVSDNLFFYFGRVVPSSDTFPTQTLLAYAIGELDAADNPNYDEFKNIVAADALSYSGQPLPTFFLQGAGTKLNAVYGSCRKIHDAKGGKIDALSMGDKLIESSVTALDTRPAIACLGGDQIYADDVDAAVLGEIIELAKKLQARQTEELPVPNVLPGVGKRKDFVRKLGKFTSDDSANHLVTFTEYLAMYGLIWNARNWAKTYSSLDHFTSTLPNARRFLANVPCYMIFDDHDVTDDWNISLQWRQDAYSYKLGRRIVTNALMAFWLCQGYGNHPDAYEDQIAYDIGDTITKRHSNYGSAETLFWGLTRWEFHTPTSPFIYFLDTRTQRGLKDGPKGTDQKPPAYLKSLFSWGATLKKLQALLAQQKDKNLPLVLVSPAPVFGFTFVEDLQKAVSILYTPFFLDFENWAANPRHLSLFLHLMGNYNVVVLSGDVHYGFTSTVKFTVFDSQILRDTIKILPAGQSVPKQPTGAQPSYEALWTARFLQLTSSALNNYANDVFTKIPANYTTQVHSVIMNNDYDVQLGKFENGEFTMRSYNIFSGNVSWEKQTKEEVRPANLFRQRINDAANSRYVADHNLGVVTFQDKSVSHYFYTLQGKDSARAWDFSNTSTWD